MLSDVEPVLGAERSRFSVKHGPVTATQNILISTSQHSAENHTASLLLSDLEKTLWSAAATHALSMPLSAPRLKDN